MKKKYNISIVGQSNTGKSSFVNYLANKYITTESKKLQTTRINLSNTINIDDFNIDIIDTPGISLINNDLLSESMKNSFIKTLDSIDIIIIMLDINNKDLNYEESIIKLVSSNTHIMLVINKIDLAKDDLSDLQTIKNKIDDKFKIVTFFISIKSKQGLNQLLQQIKNVLEGLKPRTIKKLSSSDNRKILMQEIIRGVIVESTHNELPYDSAVLVYKLEEKKSLISLYASIYVAKDNQKKIIIGKGGKMIKNIGSNSRIILEKNYNKKFFISLDVLVKENWKNNYTLLKQIGYID
jgi:GTP-binding protein Era